MKKDVLADLYGSLVINQTVIFSNTKERAVELSDYLNGRYFNAFVLHRDVNQTDRDKILKEFRTGQFRLLIIIDSLIMTCEDDI
jgi:superfamily II DNA/RNA helicase